MVFLANGCVAQVQDSKVRPDELSRLLEVLWTSIESSEEKTGKELGDLSANLIKVVNIGRTSSSEQSGLCSATTQILSSLRTL
jgi:hypothetical protein